MEKSIEDIWKEGFLKNDALVAPKINNLYHRKSMHIIDKFKRMLKINLYFVLVFAFLNLGLYAAVGTPIAGAFIFVLLIGVCWISFKQAKTLNNLNTNLSSYDYIMSFDGWLKRAISNNTKAMRFFYPLIFFGALMPIVHALKATGVTNEAILNSGFHLIYGIPTFMWIIALVIALVMYLFAGRIYQWDLNLVYGRVFEKLAELLADIEELKN
jgi:hypothetical protein